MNQAGFDHIFEGDHWAQPTTWTTDETTRRLHDTTCATRCCLVKSCGRLEKMMTPTDLRLDNLISSERNFGRMSWRWNVISLHSNPIFSESSQELVIFEHRFFGPMGCNRFWNCGKAMCDIDVLITALQKFQVLKKRHQTLQVSLIVMRKKWLKKLNFLAILGQVYQLLYIGMYYIPGTPSNQFKMDVCWFSTISY